MRCSSPARSDGERPNQQFRAVADAELSPDYGGRMTNQITLKYLSGGARPAQAHQRTRHERTLIRLVPRDVVAVASV